MIVGLKDGFRLVGIIIVSCCAVFVCTIFLNFLSDTQSLSSLVTQSDAKLFEAQIATAEFTSALSGGVLALIALFMLMFYIKLYADNNAEKLGLLKAMGYSNGRLAAEFWVFGLSVFIGAAVGFGLGFAAMPAVYRELALDGLPVAAVRFHPSLLFGLVFAPSVLFSAASVGYAYFVLKKPVSEMLAGNISKTKPRREKPAASGGKSFLVNMCLGTLGAKKSTVFFVTFACFCFSTMVQMGASMRDLSGVIMGVMILSIGLVLSVVTVIMAVTTLVRANADNIAVMKAFGYTNTERAAAVFSGYAPFALIGFGIGTAYQYGLLELTVNVFFSDVQGVPDYVFDVPVFFITLAAFAVLCVSVTAFAVFGLNRVSVKKIMNDR